MKANQQSRLRQPSPPSPSRLPSYQPSRLDDAPFWLLGVSAGCAVILFFSSMARFAANADRFVAWLQEAPAVIRQTNYAHSSPSTNRPGRFHLIQSPAGTSPTDAPGVVQPDAPGRTPSPI